jgi:hypothetical protein
MNRFRPQVNTLEARDCPAGNVAASVVNGNLVIDGDDLGNSVNVYYQSNGSWVVAGNVSNGAMTVVNNQTQVIGGHLYSFVVFNGVTGDVDIDLDGGNDKVELYANSGYAPIAGDLRIEMDGGADTVVVHDVRVGDDMTINTGSGNDIVWVERVIVGSTGGNNDLSIDTESGTSDRVTLRNVSVYDDLYLDDIETFSYSGVWVGDYFDNTAS